LPVLGYSKASPRVVYAFGHPHIGLTLGGLGGLGGSLVADLVADLVAQRPPSLDLSRYAPSRF
jgi:D-amino-acid dehydrogenase